VVAAVADTVYLMRDGSIAAEIAAAEISPENPLVRETLLLGPASPVREPATSAPRGEPQANDR
jgi:hypothetical protein